MLLLLFDFLSRHTVQAGKKAEVFCHREIGVEGNFL